MLCTLLSSLPPGRRLNRIGSHSGKVEVAPCMRALIADSLLPDKVMTEPKPLKSRVQPLYRRRRRSRGPRSRLCSSSAFRHVDLQADFAQGGADLGEHDLQFPLDLGQHQHVICVGDIRQPRVAVIVAKSLLLPYRRRARRGPCR